MQGRGRGRGTKMAVDVCTSVGSSLLLCACRSCSRFDARHRCICRCNVMNGKPRSRSGAAHGNRETVTSHPTRQASLLKRLCQKCSRPQETDCLGTNDCRLPGSNHIQRVCDRARSAMYRGIGNQMTTRGNIARTIRSRTHVSKLPMVIDTTAPSSICTPQYVHILNHAIGSCASSPHCRPPCLPT
ncbi:hypothetical protein LX36DRAFT_76173 [Colletotrichum falcatum]|nr:hypothetical protein LX36DRAFT_76173 [Colletotrichum falcatum]